MIGRKKTIDTQKQQQEAAVGSNNALRNKSGFRLGRGQNIDPVQPVTSPDRVNGKVRLSADIDHETYVKIKLYSAQKRTSIVSLVTGWIDRHCSS